MGSTGVPVGGIRVPVGQFEGSVGKASSAVCGWPSDGVQKAVSRTHCL